MITSKMEHFLLEISGLLNARHVQLALSIGNGKSHRNVSVATNFNLLKCLTTKIY